MYSIGRAASQCGLSQWWQVRQIITHEGDGFAPNRHLGHEVAHDLTFVRHPLVKVGDAQFRRARLRTWGLASRDDGGAHSAGHEQLQSQAVPNMKSFCFHPVGLQVKPKQ